VVRSIARRIDAAKSTVSVRLVAAGLDDGERFAPELCGARSMT
jgi:hypothetical protein